MSAEQMEMDAIIAGRGDATCLTCCWRNADLREEYKDNGSCRRFPPKVVIWTHPDYNGPQYDQHWPYVGPTDWCGEYRVRDALRERG